MKLTRSKSARLFVSVCLALSAIIPAFAGGAASAPRQEGAAAPPQTPVFYPVGSMAVARANHAAVLLLSGKVLVIGGDDGAYATATAELYDPMTGTWSSAGTMFDARRNPAVALLPNGKVLVAGGLGPTSPPLSSAEVYDPETNTWTLTGSMRTAVGNQTMTVLQNGKVLVTGGDDIGSTYTRCEIWDPATGIWSAVANMQVARYEHSASLLPDGKVMVAGGSNGYSRIATTEVYDPGANTWTIVGEMATATPSHTATTLLNGRILIAGGIGSINTSVRRAEIYDPQGRVWLSAGNLAERRGYHAATMLPDGRVLVVGGNNLSGNVATSEIYDPPSNTWTPGPNMTTARAGSTATTLPNGDVLVAGGNHNGSLASAEIYGISDCTIECPLDVTFPTGSATATGANVVYPAPTTTGTCGTLSCDPPSGSFFLVGTTTVTCTAGFGADCSFTVSVVNNPPPTISSVEFVKPQGQKPSLVIRGTGLQPGVVVQINGLGFRAAATVAAATTATQQGKLVDGTPLKRALPRGVAVNVSVLNVDGGSAVTSYTRP